MSSSNQHVAGARREEPVLRLSRRFVRGSSRATNPIEAPSLTQTGLRPADRSEHVRFACFSRRVLTRTPL
jgi:hypothetical protein